MVTPTKINVLYADAAKAENIPESDLEDIVVGSYKIMRANLSEGLHARQEMPGLGCFVVKTKELKKGHEVMLRLYENVKSRAGWMKDSVTEQLAFFDRLTASLKKEADYKVEIKKKQFEYNKAKREKEQNKSYDELNGEIANFMEEQEPDC